MLTLFPPQCASCAVRRSPLTIGREHNSIFVNLCTDMIVTYLQSVTMRPHPVHGCGRVT